MLHAHKRSMLSVPTLLEAEVTVLPDLRHLHGVHLQAAHTRS